MSFGNYTLIRRVSVPTISMRDPGEYFFRLTSPIRERPDQNNPDKPLRLISVVNLSTGEVGEIVVATVLAQILREHYPSEAYVDRSFRILKRPSGKGGRGGQNEYNLFYVDEIEVEVANSIETSKLPELPF